MRLYSILFIFIFALPSLAKTESLNSYYSQKNLQKLNIYQADYTQVKTLKNWMKIYRMAQKQQETFARPFDKKHDAFVRGKVKTMPQFEHLMTHFPGYTLGYAAEGTILQFNMNYVAFQKLAQNTASKYDDRFIALLIQSYGKTSGHYGSWLLQTWDYGGCSQLGKGVSLKILKEIQMQLKSKSPFTPELTALRKLVLDHALEWKWMCQKRKAVQSELKSILKQIDLSRKERQRLKARLPLKNVEFSCLTHSCSMG